ncbi:hypothetical protein FRC01_012808 [Tulasnella sp. 417]|nr:hypothetical protein FRC01_012808 [Tulasnella sp. 417]
MSSEAPKPAAHKETTGGETAPSLNEPPDGMLPLINRIPFDIFQVIITMCQEKSPRAFRFTISHVCHLWREYVLAMPLLWNSLRINKPVPRWEMLETMLKRSGQALLDIYIGQSPFVKSALPHLRKIMQMIIPHLGRWRTLHLSDAPYKVRRILLDQIRAKPAPHLEDIKISQSFMFDRPSRLKLDNRSPNWRAKNVFLGFHNLHSVEWTHSISDLSRLPTFKNLRSLTIGEATISDGPPRPFVQLLHRILLDSPSLETFEIYNYLNYTWHENAETEAMNLQLPPLTHPSLEALFIESSDSIRSAAIRSLILPKLRTFSAEYDADPIDPSCCDIIAQENSLPELRVVSIGGYIHDHVTRESFLLHMPFLRPAIQNLANLRVLTLRAIDFDEGQWLPDLGHCCPHLRWLLFIHCVGLPIAPIRLLVETRMHTDGINPLEILCIQAFYDAPPEYTVSEEDVAWFSEFLKFKQEDDCSYTEPEAR